MVRRLMEWTAKTAILDLPTPMHRPSHVTTQCIGTENTVFSPHHKDHLGPYGFALDLVQLQFRTLADALPLGLRHVRSWRVTGLLQPMSWNAKSQRQNFNTPHTSCGHE